MTRFAREFGFHRAVLCGAGAGQGRTAPAAAAAVGYESASQFSREFKRMRVRGRARCRAAPRIARQQDCQTCFMCELYCPEDALYVAPLADRPATAEELAGFATSQAGAYRRAVGWGRGRRSTAQDDASYELLGRTH